VAKDDEFRKVAEDIGALARSLGRDFRDAVDQARQGGHGPGRAVRHGLRDMTDEARRGMRTGWTSSRHGRAWAPWGCGSGYHEWGPPPGASPPPPGGPAPPPWVQGRTWTGPGGRHAGPNWAGPGRSRSRRQPLPPVRHRWDASTVIGLLAVLFGVAWLIGAMGVLHVSIEGVVAVGLMLLGASLVITGRTDWSLSRRSWPVWLGAGLIVVLVATSSTFGLGGALNSVSFGTKNVIAQGALPTGTVHGGFGNLNVNLSSATTSGTVKVVSVAGNTTVTPPPGDTIDIDARVGAGQICLNGTSVASGVAAQYQQTLPGATPTNPTVTLDVHQVFGQIVIGTPGCKRK